MLVKTIRDELRNVTDRAKAVMAKAEDEQRLLTDAERGEIDAALQEAEKLRDRIERSERDTATVARLEAMLGGGGKPAMLAPAGPPVVKSLGQQWVESDAYRDFIKRPGARGGAWSTVPVELFRPSAATLTTGTGIVPGTVLPDIVRFPEQFRVASLFGQGTVTDGSVIPFMTETVGANTAAEVAEGGLKPEATMTFTQESLPLRTIAHWLPVTDQMLEDLEGIRSYIDARLTDGVIQREESQLINGDGVAPNIRGILATPGLGTAVPVVGGAFADAIHAQMVALMTASFTVPDAIVASPIAWHTMLTERNGTGGGYLSGGTFQAEIAPRMWGLPVALSPNMEDDEALVGAFKTQAMVWRKGGIVVQASNSHADYFIRNMTAIRAEERVQLTVFRPSAFGLVTGIA